MKYTYKGKDNPKDIKLNYPEVEDILSKQKNDITHGEATELVNLLSRLLQYDCEALSLKQIGRQWGKFWKN